MLLYRTRSKGSLDMGLTDHVFESNTRETEQLDSVSGQNLSRQIYG